MDSRQRIWQDWYHDQPFQAGKRSKGYRSCQAGKIQQLSKMSALSGKWRLCRKSQSSGKGEPQDHRDHHQWQSMGLPVLSICLLQWTLYRIQQSAYSDENREKHIYQAVWFCKAVPALFPWLQCGPSDRRRFYPQPRSFPGRTLYLCHGKGRDWKACDDPGIRRCGSRHCKMASFRTAYPQ